MEAINVDYLVNGNLLAINEALSKEMDADCIFINSLIIPPLDSNFRIVVEKIAYDKNKPKKDNLVILLQTRGGFMEIVERLVATMRAHYKKVSFIVPDYAYSAGTVLALSGDEIWMDYYSVLGPIDPQYANQDGINEPGQGLLEKYNEIVNQINVKLQNKKECRAEMHYLIQKFDPMQLYRIRQHRQHGVSLIVKWLPEYKFKNWTKTEGRGEKVTPKMKKDRARKIAEVLGDASLWHSHGRGIHMTDLTGESIKLIIDDLSKKPMLYAMVRDYHGLAVDYFGKMGLNNYIHSRPEIKRIA